MRNLKQKLKDEKRNVLGCYCYYYYYYFIITITTTI